MSRDISIVIPTYMEADNLRVLVPRIVEVCGESTLAPEILVVDDDSPDNTAVVCESLSRIADLTLHSRKTKRGLASAVVDGIGWARHDVVVVMDADGSHAPSDLPRLVAPVVDGEVDMVLGSRYVPGAVIDERWSANRRMMSRAGAWLARPLTHVRDPLAGYFAINRRAIANSDEIVTLGFKIGLEYLCMIPDHRVREIPIGFSDRSIGESKLTLRCQFDYLRQLIALYLKSQRRLSLREARHADA